MDEHDSLRYPIGRYQPARPTDGAQTAAWIDTLERLPADLRRVVEGLGEARLDTPYRPGGWTARQVVHHIPDASLNGYVRFKWALTEQRPTIKIYHEDPWAEQHDYRLPVAASLDLLAALHRRWVELLRGLGPAELARELVHPEAGVLRLDEMIGLYAWHGRHHLAHVELVAHAAG